MPEDFKSMSEKERMALVGHYLSKGLAPSDVKRAIKEKFGYEMTAHEPFNYFRQIVNAGLLTFLPSKEDELGKRLKDVFFLSRADVTYTSYVEDVAALAAYRIFRLLRQRLLGRDREDVHIGFSGGHTTRLVFQRLAQLFVTRTKDLPAKVTCHALVPGFDDENPGTDPTSFFVYMADQQPKAIHFVLFHAPSILPPDLCETFLNLPTTSNAREGARKLDLIVTSAADFEDPDSQLRKYYAKYSPTTLKDLEDQGCKGDVLWSPIGEQGPMATLEYQAVALVKLEEFPVRIAEGKRILMVLGPCARCGRTRTNILRTILGLKPPYITDLVTDKRTAQELLDWHEGRTQRTVAAHAP